MPRTISDPPLRTRPSRVVDLVGVLLKFCVAVDVLNASFNITVIVQFELTT